MNGSIGNAVANHHISHFVLSGGAHPAVHSVGRSKGALLEYAQSAGSGIGAKLIPAHASNLCAWVHGMVDHQSLMAVSKMAIGEAIHQAVSQGIKLLPGARLRN